ncbi:hypothetical protein BSR42_09530, partial [Megasphaera cerevisiae]
ELILFIIYSLLEYNHSQNKNIVYIFTIPADLFLNKAVYSVYAIRESISICHDIISFKFIFYCFIHLFLL